MLQLDVYINEAERSQQYLDSILGRPEGLMQQCRVLAANPEGAPSNEADELVGGVGGLVVGGRRRNAGGRARPTACHAAAAAAAAAAAEQPGGGRLAASAHYSPAQQAAARHRSRWDERRR